MVPFNFIFLHSITSSIEVFVLYSAMHFNTINTPMFLLSTFLGNLFFHILQHNIAYFNIEQFVLIIMAVLDEPL